MAYNYDDIKKKLKEEIIEKIDLSKDYSDEEIMDLIDNQIMNSRSEIRISFDDKTRLAKER